MSALRIVHLCRVGWPRLGGMEAAVQGLARDQVQRGHSVRVLTLRTLRRGEAPLTDGEHEGVRYERVAGLGPGRYPFPLGLRRAVGSADFAHVHGIDGFADVAVRRLDMPVGVSTHGGYFHTTRQAWLKPWVLRTLTAATLRRAAAVWYTSQADRERFAGAGVPGKVLGNGVDVRRFAGGRAPEPGRWMMLGRVQSHKGLADIARLLPSLEVTLHVVGQVVEPEHVADVIQRLKQAGCAERLVVHGALSEAGVREQLQRAEAVVAPSRSEGFGIAVVEAMGAGVPVIVSSGTALEELISDGGGWAVDFRSGNALEQLKDWVGGDHTAMGTRAQAVAMRYGWGEVGAQWEQAIRAVLES